MKKWLLPVSFAIAITMCGCETITSDDGTTTTRFDAKAAAGVLDTGLRAYDQYNRQRHIVGYTALGEPIYAQ